jgi:hypothetical protein
MTAVAIEIPEELIQALSAELRDHARGFACQAGETQDNLHRPVQSGDSFKFGDLWKDKDYAWRALLNPSFQVEVMQAIGNRAGLALVEEQLDMVCPILEALSDTMPEDAMIDLMTEGDGAAEVISENLLAYFTKAITPPRIAIAG